MLADVLRRGFALAHTRALRLLFLDILWKAVWAVLTLAGVMLVVMWIMSDLNAVEWEDTGVVNGLIASLLIREYWSANRGEIVGTWIALACVSAVVWILLEAYFRRSIVRQISIAKGNGPRPEVSCPLYIFLGCSAIKHAVLFTSAVCIAAASFAGAPTIAIVVFLAVAFLLTILDTVIRADAVDLLGTDLIRVTGVLGILMSFEAMITASAVAGLAVSFLNIGEAADAVVMLGAAAVAAVFLTVLHSYMMLVRFSAIVVMRQNVVEV